MDQISSSFYTPPISFLAVSLDKTCHVIQLSEKRNQPISYPSSDFIEQKKQIHFGCNCFVEVSSEEIKILVSKAVPQYTKKSTKYAVNVFDSRKTPRVWFPLQRNIAQIETVYFLKVEKKFKAYNSAFVHYRIKFSSNVQRGETMENMEFLKLEVL